MVQNDDALRGPEVAGNIFSTRGRIPGYDGEKTAAPITLAGRVGSQGVCGFTSSAVVREQKERHNTWIIIIRHSVFLLHFVIAGHK